MLLAGRSCGLYVSRGAQGERVSGWKRDSDRWIQFAASMKMNRSELQINHIVSSALLVAAGLLVTEHSNWLRMGGSCNQIKSADEGFDWKLEFVEIEFFVRERDNNKGQSVNMYSDHYYY